MEFRTYFLLGITLLLISTIVQAYGYTLSRNSKKSLDESDNLLPGSYSGVSLAKKRNRLHPSNGSQLVPKYNEVLSRFNRIEKRQSRSIPEPLTNTSRNATDIDVEGSGSISEPIFGTGLDALDVKGESVQESVPEPIPRNNHTADVEVISEPESTTDPKSSTQLKPEAEFTLEPKLTQKSTSEPESSAEPRVDPKATSKPKPEQKSSEKPLSEPKSTVRPTVETKSTTHSKPKHESIPKTKSTSGLTGEYKSTTKPKTVPHFISEPKPEPIPEQNSKPESIAEATSTTEPKAEPKSTPELEFKSTADPALAAEPTAEPKSTAEPEPESTPEPKSTSEHIVKPKSTVEPIAEAKSTAEPKPEPESTPEPTSERKSTAEPTSESRTSTISTPEPKSTAEPKPEPESTPEPTSQHKSTAEPTSKPKSTSEPTAEPKSLAEPEPELTPKPTSEPKSTSEPTSAPKSTPEPTAETELTPEPNPEPKSTSEPEATSEPKSTPESTAEPRSIAEPEPESTPEPTAEPKSTHEPNPEPKSTSEPKPTSEPKSTSEPTSKPKITPEPTAEPKSTAEPKPEPESTPEPTAEPKSTHEPNPEPKSTSEPKPTSEPKSTSEPTSEPKITPEPTAEPKSTAEPKPEPESTPEPTAEPKSTHEPNPEPKSTSEPKPTSEPKSTSEPTSEPKITPEPTAEPKSTAEPKPEPESTPEPTAEPKSTHEPNPEPKSTSEPKATSEPKLTNRPGFSSPGVEPSPEPEPGTAIPGVEPEPESEFSAFSEPNPDWDEAMKKWQWGWDVLVYVFGVLFLLLGVYSFLSVTRLWKKKHLLSKNYFMVLNILIIFKCILRGIYLLVDAFNRQGTFHTVIAYFLYSTTFPCITAAFSILFYALLLATKMKVLSAKIQKISILVGIIVFHFVLSLATDIVVGLFSDAKIMLLVCQFFYILWGIVLFSGYFYIYRRLHESALTRQKTLTKYTSNTSIGTKTGTLTQNKNNPPRKKKSKYMLTSAIKVTLVAAVVGLMCVAVELYGIFGVYKVYLVGHTPQPWPWYIYQFLLRVTELIMCSLMVYVASQPIKYRHKKAHGICYSCCLPIRRVLLCDKEDVSDAEVTSFASNNLVSSNGSDSDLKKKKCSKKSTREVYEIRENSGNGPQAGKHTHIVIEDGVVRFRKEGEVGTERAASLPDLLSCSVTTDADIIHKNSNSGNINEGYTNSLGVSSKNMYKSALSVGTIGTIGTDYHAPSLNLADSMEWEYEQAYDRSFQTHDDKSVRSLSCDTIDSTEKQDNLFQNRSAEEHHSS